VETSVAAAHATDASTAVANMVYDNPVFHNNLEQEERDQEVYDSSSVAAIHLNGLDR